MNDKREGTETAPDSVQRIIADLEIIDRKLGELLAAHGAPDTDSRAKARTLLRSAIETLALAAPAEVSEDAGTGKRRVKIKAESEVAPPSETAREGTAAKAGKSASRGNRGNAAGRKSTSTDKASPPGLLARLGAAAEAPPIPQASAEPAAAAPKAVEAGDSLKATADRLAQLEAEIADLTEAVTAVPTRQAAAASEQRQEPPLVSPSVEAGGQADADSDDDEVAEITIIGANGAQRPAPRSAAREAPRVFRDGPLPDEDEAEVEIRGDGAASHRRRVADRAGAGHEVLRRNESSGGRGTLAKWRIFRGSN